MKMCCHFANSIIRYMQQHSYSNYVERIHSTLNQHTKSLPIFPGRTQSLLQPVLYRKQFLQGTPVLTKLQYRLAL